MSTELRMANAKAQLRDAQDAIVRRDRRIEELDGEVANLRRELAIAADKARKFNDICERVNKARERMSVIANTAGRDSTIGMALLHVYNDLVAGV